MKRSLHGLSVLNTRPKHQAKTLSQQIEKAGGQAIEYPALEIKPPQNNWLGSLPNLNTAQFAIFVSPNAVNYCFNVLRTKKIVWPSQILTFAIGQSTARALNEYHIPVSGIPILPDSEHLLQLPELAELNQQTVLLFKGEGGRDVIENDLTRQGTKIFVHVVYQKKIPPFCPHLTQSIWQENQVDIILFTSEQSMQNLFTMFGKEALDWLWNKPCVVLSQRLARTASRLGIKNIIISHPENIMDALFDYSQGLFHDQ